jgi:Domain of unknown function (DUF2828)
MANSKSHTLLDSSFPVLLPYFPELLISDTEFRTYIDSINSKGLGNGKELSQKPKDNATDTKAVDLPTSPFIHALATSTANVHTRKSLSSFNKTLTENNDVALISSGSPLVDLFYKLKDNDVDESLLQKAWDEDPTATLKIIFNARSIHLGKGDRLAAYRAFGWLYQNHPRTFLVNLPWLARPVIPRPKKDTKDGKEAGKEDGKEANVDDEFELIEPEFSSYSTRSLDQENGLAHGYWKDLLNMLALAANDEFSVGGDPKKILNAQGYGKSIARKRKREQNALTHKWKREWDQDKAKVIRKEKRTNQWESIVEKFSTDTIYRAFHLAVARLFAEQLQHDLVALKSSGPESKRLSLAAKWAPSLKEFHDKNTFMASSIAEIMFPHDQICPDVAKNNRELYLKHARIAYRFQVLSPLRKSLDIVERHISAESFEKIKYEKVPSLAMNCYEKLFFDKDLDNFTTYVEKVALGEKKISGAILLPSILVSKVSEHSGGNKPRAKIQASLQHKIIDGQWKSLVNRVKESGKIESSIAVCDVSGSMCSPVRDDKTTPMDSAIGLSLLLAEVCEPPFGGAMITFSSNPSFVQVGGVADKRNFAEKVGHIKSAEWGMSTDFVAVFERLILPLAQKHKLSQEDMVKQIFVFSDMQFNQAAIMHDRWSSSYERIKKKYEVAGYEMPTLIFWNLAAYTDGVPVDSNEPGTILVSGYSQGQMKMFLDNGGFEDAEDEVVAVDSNEDGLVMINKEKVKVDPMIALKKALSHPAYGMLKVVD